MFFFQMNNWFNVPKTVSNEPPIWEWFIVPIYGDLGGGLLLFEPHYIDYFMSTIKNSNQQGFFRND